MRRPAISSWLTPAAAILATGAVWAMSHSAARLTSSSAGEPAELTAVVNEVCATCHNDEMLYGNLSLEGFDVAVAHWDPETTEKMVVKLRAGMMPPPSFEDRPDEGTLQDLVETLERLVDDDVGQRPDPGSRPFQRLNRAEYESSILDLLDLDIDAGDYLPLDTKSANFDNIADVQLLSATIMDAYLRAAGEISRLAVGDPHADEASATYTNAGYVSQWERVEDAPRGTRGGISVQHNFAADGHYVFQLAFEHTTTGGFYGRTSSPQQLEIAIDGQRVALLAVDRWMHVSDPNGVNMETEPIFVRAGPRQVSAVFVRTFEGPVEDLLSPHEWSLADRQIGVSGYGITALPHLKDLVIRGPRNPAGVSDTPTRRRIFSCRPTSAAEARPCAESILARLASQAFRRPVSADEMQQLMSFYDQGQPTGFEEGIRNALNAILASPDFVFRLEAPAGAADSAGAYPISDLALASRLSFFLWGRPPDAELIEIARQNRLSEQSVLAQQTRRMLADPKSAALATRFAAQWLRLDDLDKVHPDRLLFPDFHQQLADAMRRETELFFEHLVSADRSLLELFTADYTFVNERLADHYGLSGVTGRHFRRIRYQDSRRGILGHGSILTLTSHANRTSPVLRGKWVLEVLIGVAPPPPPPGIPDLEETQHSRDGRVLTTRERLELHRSNPSCNSCHVYIDPIGLALDNYDVTGRWRIREHGMPLETLGIMYDGTPVQTPEQLIDALLKRPVPLVRTFTENLMAYALGRRVEYFDKPAIRAIARQAAADDYRLSSFILGVVQSRAFRMQRAPEG